MVKFWKFVDLLQKDLKSSCINVINYVVGSFYKLLKALILNSFDISTIFDENEMIYVLKVLLDLEMIL